MNRGKIRGPLLLLALFILFTRVETAAQRTERYAPMVKALLSQAQTGERNRLIADFFSKNADSALLWKRLSVLQGNWKKYGHKADSIQYDGSVHYMLEGTGFNVVLVLLKYRGTNWDELLLLADQTDEGLLDIANPEDVLSFNQARRGRYHKLIETPERLFSFFSAGYGGADLTILNKDNALKAAQRIIRLVQHNRKDSLYGYIAYNRKDDPKRKYLEEACSPDEARDRAFVNRIFYDLQGLFTGPETMWISGNFSIDVKNNSVRFRAECKGTKNGRHFHFVYRKGKFLLVEF